MKNVTKQDLVQEAARSSGLSQAAAKLVIEELLKTVGDRLSQAQTIEIRGFGTFYVKERKPRPARNPRTGQLCPLDRRKVPLLKFSSEVKELVQGTPATTEPAMSLASTRPTAAAWLQAT